MAIHHKKKEKYQGMKNAGMTAEELKEEMLNEGVSVADTDQFIIEAYQEQPEAPNEDKAPEDQEESIAESEPPAATTGPKFNYKGLTGEAYKQYKAHVDALPLFGLQDFQVFKAEPVVQERYPGLPDSPRDMVGIRITNDTPIHTTRIDIKTAKELNAQLANSRRIYLLKQ